MGIESSVMEPFEKAKFIIRNRDDRGYIDAYNIFTREARNGNHEAEYSLGLMYARGQGVTKDYGAALSWFQRAYDGGYLVSGYYLGKMHLMGLGTAKDPERARRLFESVASFDCRAMYELGLLFFTGEDLERDLTLSSEWLMKAAELGHPEAQFVLGQFYKAGAGVERDPEEAVRWLTAAALNRHKGAQILLGNMYRTGDGVDVDIAESDRWYDMADGRTNPPQRRRSCPVHRFQASNSDSGSSWPSSRSFLSSGSPIRWSVSMMPSKSSCDIRTRLPFLVVMRTASSSARTCSTIEWRSLRRTAIS